MFSLIITIFAIALVIALVLVTAYYGGPIFMGNGARIAAETLISQSVQIGAARQVAIAQGRALPGGSLVNLPEDLLRTMPTPPSSAYVSGSPTQDDWEYYVPGVSTHFGIPTKINKSACMEINKGQGFIGIPAAWDGTSAIQCFGPSPTGYTYLFQPTGTTPQQRDAILQHAIDVAKPEIPGASAGYPRLCPNGETITSGVCDGGSATPPPTGFWLITASASGYYTTSLTSGGYVTSCPAGAINPTTGAAQPAPSKAGEAFNVDGLVRMEWTLPPSYSTNFPGALTRTWCIPANEEDVLSPFTGGYSEGGVTNIVQGVVPANATDPESYTASYNKTALITAGGQEWALLSSAFYADTENKVNGNTPTMLGHKVAIGRTTTASETYFVNSPVLNFNGVQYQNTEGAITFPAPQPACRPLAKTAPLGTGGRIVDIVEASDASMMLKEDGSVWTTGEGSEAMLGTCDLDGRYTWTRVATGATKIMADTDSFYFIKTDGTVWGTGSLTRFLGPDFYSVMKFTQIPVSNVAKIHAGTGSLFVQRTDGTLWQLDKEIWDTSGRSYSPPLQVASNVKDVTPVRAGFYALKTDNSVWYQTWAGASSKVADNVAQFTATDNSRMWVGRDGLVYAWGNDGGSCNIFGVNTPTGTYSTATQVASHIGPAAHVYMSGNHTYILGADGTLWGAGCNDSGREVSYFGDGTFNARPAFTTMATGVKLFTGTFVVNTSDALYAFGNNYSGQFGNGTHTNSFVFVPVAY
jgi:alpha-tubulin suppressor-like RCC1 family protein